MRVQVLQHHAVSILKQFLTPPYVLPGEEESEIRTFNLREMKNARLPNGQPKYPNLNCEAYVKAKTELTQAVLDETAEIIPDTNTSGNDNFDDICKACGNIEIGKNGIPRCKIKRH